MPSVPDRVPLPGLVPIATVIWFVAVVTTFPAASSMLTWTAGVIEPAIATLLGCTVKASLAAAPNVTLNAPLVAPVSPEALADSVYPVPAALMFRFENVATPATAATGDVPLNVPPDGLVPMAMLTELVAVVTRLPSESSMLTAIAGVIEFPETTLLGCRANTSLFAVPAVTLNALLVMPVSPEALAVNV